MDYDIRRAILIPFLSSSYHICFMDPDNQNSWILPYSFYRFSLCKRIMVTLETSLRYSSFFLKCLSSSPPSSKTTTLQKVLNVAHFLFVFFIATSIFLQISIYILQNSTGSNFITEHVSIQLAFLRLISNVTMYRINEKKFFRLLNTTKSMLKNSSLELKTHLLGHGRIANVVYIVYTSTVFLMATDICMMPLFRAERDLPIAAWYPFDYKNSSFLYSVAYFHQTLAIIMCWFCSGMDVMFGILVFSCCARYKLLQKMLREINKRAKLKTDQQSTVQFDKKLAKLIHFHCEILDSINDINDLYMFILFILMLTSMIMICCAGLQATSGCVQSINAEFIFTAIVCCVLLNLLFYFAPGDILVREANAVRTEAYNSDWESMSPKYRNYILLVILRSARPPKLAAAGVLPLILENYASFLVSTGSYFTSLRAIAGDNRQ